MSEPSRAKLPEADLRLFRFLDCLRYSLVILGDQYGDLNALLERMGPSDSPLIIRAVSVSWSIVDSIHRVREVAQNIPAFSGKDSELRDFLKKTSVVETLRNYIQHLRNELAKSNLDDFPVWGTFSWVDKDNICHTAMTGTFTPNISFQSVLWDRLTGQWVSKAALAMKGRIFNVDPCYQSTVRFCNYALKWIRTAKKSTVSEKSEIPVVSARFTYVSKLPDEV